MIGLGNLGHLGKLGHVSTTGMNQSEVEASGRAFPIWNTKPGDDKLMSLSIHGLTEQIGTPTPANPVPMRSVGDMGLLLSVMPNKECSDYQLLNIKAAMNKAGHDGILRSVNGIYDEVVYDGKKWKLIQRVKEYSVDDLSYPGNYVFTKNEYESNVHYYIQYKTYQNDLVSNVNSPFMSDYSDKPFWPGISSKGVGYYFGQLCFSMLNGETTETEALNITKGRHYQGLLITPIEYELDLPVITTYDEQTYFASNAAEVKPRMVARCQVSKAMDYIREGLIGYYTGRGRSNDDENKNILPDLSGNGNDLENKNFAYTPESGYGDGYIQYDGIDDFSMLPTDKNFKSGVKTQIFVFSATQSTTETDNKWNGGIVREHYFAIQRNQVPAKSDYEQVYLNGTDVKTTGFKINGSTEINTIVISKTKNVSDFNKNLNISTILNAPVYCIKQRFHEALLYDRILTEEEIQHNYKVSCQYNGEDIDGKVEETTSSGDNGFTVYNSLPGIFEELTVYGKSAQDGTPTPANPIPIKSVGDTPLILTISNGTETQQINFGDIKLRSVGTVSDELVFDNSVGKWKLIQRIGSDILSEAINMYSSKYSWCTYSSIYDYKLNLENGRYGDLFASNKFVASSGIGGVENSVGLYSIPTNICATTNKVYETIEECKAYIGTFDIIGVLSEPIETELDFESPKTFSGEVTVTTNQETVHPYMTARIAVGEKLTLPADPLAVYIAGKQTTGDNTFKDQSGNGNDIPLYNLAHSAESGFFQGALHLDGVDDTGRLPLESFNPAITAETSIFLSGKVNETGTKYFNYLRTRDGVSTALSRLIPGNTGLFIAYYPLSLTGNPDVNLLNTYKLTYNNNNMLDQLLSPANKTYYNLAGFLQGGSQVELGKLDYRYLIIYPRNLTKEEQAIVLKYIEQGIYEL